MHASGVLGASGRRRVLELPADGEQTSRAVTDVIRAGFASVRAEDTRRFHTVEPALLREADAWLDLFRRFWEQRPGPARWGPTRPERDGWELGLLALARLLAGDNPTEFEEWPDGCEFSRRSTTARGRPPLAAGGEPEQVAAAVEATTKSYVPDL